MKDGVSNVAVFHHSTLRVNVMKSPVFSLFLLVLLFPFSTALAENPQTAITQISHDIEQTKDPKLKSKLLVYRARQYSKANQLDMAREDYNDALELNHKGWIHLERSQFFLAIGKYEIAYEDANAAKEEVPTLTREADKVIDKAVAEVRKQYEAENPTTIIMDTKVDPYRKTRFDIMREQGVFVAKAERMRNSNMQRAASRKQTSAAACAPKAKS